MNASRYSLPAVVFALTTTIVTAAVEPKDSRNEERQPIATAATAKAATGQRQRPIKLKSGEFLPVGDLNSNIARAKARQPKAKTAHVILQFEELPDAGNRARLESVGIRLLGYLPENAYFATVPLHLPNEQLRAVGITWLGGVHAEDKIAPSLRERGPAPRSQAADSTVNLWVRYFEDVAPADAEKAVEQVGARVLSHVHELQRITVNAASALINDIADLDSVRWIQDLLPPPVPQNDASRANTQAETVQSPPDGLSGTGVVLGQWDGGLVDNTHPDLSARVIHGESGSVDDHATHVAGTMLGNGSGSAAEGGRDRQWRGMAPSATVLSYTYNGATIWDIFDNSIKEHKSAIEQYGIVLSQNSWGENVQPGLFGWGCSDFGDYDFGAPDYDKLVTGLYFQTINVVFSAGNSRNDGICRMSEDWPYLNYSCVTPPATAKNTITVGAINAEDASMTDFSSWGPADDGRIKPDLVAPGELVYSTVPSSTYEYMSGTSMAAPAVSGCIALLVEDYRSHNGGLNPLPGTVRALLLHTAQDLNESSATYLTEGPDYASGYGRIQLKDAIDQLRGGKYALGAVGHHGTNSYSIQIPAGATQAKFTIAWDDPAGQENARPALVNDLDLVVLDPNGSRRYPWTLNPNAVSYLNSVVLQSLAVPAEVQTGQLTIEYSTISQYSTAGIDVTGSGRATARFCSFVDTEKDYGVRNLTATNVLARSNWWGAASGPSTVGPGTGVKVSTNVDYANWLTSVPTPPLQGTPQITSAPSRYALYGAPYAYDANHRATAIGTGTVTWSKVIGPDTLSINPTTSEITWTPLALGTHYIVISAQDNIGTDFQSFAVFVDLPQGDAAPPRVARFNYTLTGDSPFTAQLTTVFSEPVLVDISDIAVLNSASQTVPFSSYEYSTADNSLSVAVPGLSAGQTYRLVLTDTITDRAGNALDGEFNGYGFPTGNGIAGGQFAAAFVMQTNTIRPRLLSPMRLPDGSVRVPVSDVQGSFPGTDICQGASKEDLRNPSLHWAAVVRRALYKPVRVSCARTSARMCEIMESARPSFQQHGIHRVLRHAR